jgi:hypothetical protein
MQLSKKISLIAKNIKQTRKLSTNISKYNQIVYF